MKGKILFLIALLVLAIFLAGCKEQAGEGTKTLMKTTATKMCRESSVSNCTSDTVMAVQKTFADCTTSTTNVPCASGQYCTVISTTEAVCSVKREAAKTPR